MIVQLLTSFTGALGFCLVFHLRRRYMFAASLGGLLTCGVYLAAASIWSGILLPTLTAAAFAALYAEFLAWFMGAPATLFLIPALLILPRAFGLLGLQMAQPIADLCTAIFAFFIVHKVMQQLKNRPDVV